MTDRPAPNLFDPQHVAQNRRRAVLGYKDNAFLKQRESHQLVERLADVSRKFPRALDYGCHDGSAARAMLDSGQVGEVIAYDVSPAMVEIARANGLTAMYGDAEHLPFEEGRFDLITSVLSLHWVNDLPGLLVQFRRLLKPDGLFLSCLFGGGTLSELRTCLIEAESEITGGASARISPLPSLQDTAALLQRAGFALPVADVDRVTVRYSSPLNLMQDIKAMGEQAAFARSLTQPRRPLSRRILQRTTEIYHDRYSDPDGKVRASFEIIWLSGWAPAAGQPQPLRPGSARASLADAVRRVRSDKA